MAEGKVDTTLMKRTQDSLGKYVKKPPLTEKLLKKPPFRFLYDVFNAVIKETGCFEGLYTLDEQNIENIKDRDDKMKYLQKMVDVIKIATKKSVSVRTSKIVAGQEPEKTNELLQLIGEVIEKKLDWRSAVDKVVNKSSSPTKPHKAPEKTKEKSVKSKEQSKDSSKEPKTSTKISPSTKEEQKNKPKNTSPKEMLKTNNAKSNKEKQGIETKDKTLKRAKEEKLKSNKSKTVVKDKTPSPTKDEPKEKKTIPIEENTKNVSKQDEDESREKLIMPSNEVVVSPTNNQDINEVPANVQVAEHQRTAIQKTETVIHKTKQNENQIEHKETESPKKLGIHNRINNETDTEHMESDSRNKSGSRKSSANRKSTERSRRFSANKIHTNENEIPQESTNQTESLNKLNEEESPKSVPSMETQVSALEQPKSTTESPKMIDNYVHNVKRESTFTRENSKDNSNNRPRTSLRPPSARPASARPGAPRRRDRNIEIILQPNDKIKMSGVNVKLETFGDFGDDGENLVIIENANVEETLGELGSKSAVPDNALNTEDNMEQQGHLVQQILETQKELVQQNRTDMTGKQDKDLEVSSAVNMRQSSARQMNNLRDVIQNLTKSVNPFGKLMDFIPEDIDAMQLELTMWRDSYTQTANELRKEKSLTESVTEPMKNQLIQIEGNIKEYQEIIDASHSKILQNSEKILKMLTEQ